MNYQRSSVFWFWFAYSLIDCVFECPLFTCMVLHGDTLINRLTLICLLWSCLSVILVQRRGDSLLQGRHGVHCLSDYTYVVVMKKVQVQNKA